MLKRYRSGVRLLLAAAVLLLLTGCPSLLFHPSSTLVRSPADMGLAYRDIELTAVDGTALHGWWLPAEGEPRATVYFLHGNAENISTHIASVWWLPARGYNVFLLDYRGFGRSGGKPGFPGVIEDVDAGLQWLVDELPLSQPLVMLGQSLGASVGGFVAATRVQYHSRLAAVVLDAGFTGYRDLAREVAAHSLLTRPFARLAAGMMPGEYDLLEVIAELAPLPVMIIHGDYDRVIPPHHGERLYEAAGQPKQLLRYPGGHIATFGGEDNREALVDYLKHTVAAWHEGRTQ